MILSFLALGFFASVTALDNGLARTPPMGWMSWERFRCQVDCDTLPNECISEKLITSMADILVSEGYSDVGYQYVIVDDCWLANERNGIGKLQPDPKRFPSGIKALANYVQSKRLKFGIYENYGDRTCEGYPGTYLHHELVLDAETFAEWNVDYVKLDACFTEVAALDNGYISFGRFLNQTGRHIVYSCSWPYYHLINQNNVNLKMVGKHCNLFRIFHDIKDSWQSVKLIMEFFGDNQRMFAPYTGPGHWVDPDMLIIGNYGLSLDQSKTQMAIWAILSAPLIMSNDLRNIRPEFKDILQNREIIAINQDKLGKQGQKVLKVSDVCVWMKPVSPVAKDSSYAIAFVGDKEYGPPISFNVSLKTLNLKNSAGYEFQDLYEDGNKFILKPNDFICGRVNPTGVVIFKATVQK